MLLNVGPFYHTENRSTRLSPDQQVALAKGYNVSLIVNGRTHIIRHDGKYYGCGMMRATTHDALTALIGKVVR